MSACRASCRLERTAAVQHLVSTVTGQLADDRDAFDLLAASFPGGSITGAPKIRAMEILEALEPVRRGPYTGALGWIGPDGAMQTSIIIRTFVADGRKLTLHVGGGITYRSPTRPRSGTRPSPRRAGRSAPSAAVEVRVSGDAGLGPGHVWVDGRILPADGPHLSVFDRGFQLGDGIFETLRVRGDHPTELARAPGPTAALCRRARHLAAERPGRARSRRGSPTCSPPRASTARTATHRSGSPYRAARSAAGASSRPTRRRPRRSRSRPGPSPRRRPITSTEGSTSSPRRVRRDPANPLATLKTTSRADYVYARVEARRAGADDALFLTVDGRLSEGTSANIFLIRRASHGDGLDELATPSLDCAILPGTTRSWLLDWAGRVGLRPVGGPPDAGRPRWRVDEAFLCSSVAGILPVTRFGDAPIGAGIPGPWTRRARADREAMIRAGASPPT